MRMPRTLLVGVAIVAVAIVGALWWVYASRDSLVKQAIERFGPAITGVSVAVASVKLEPLDGRGEIRRLEVGNPPGYKAPRALTLGEIRLAIDPASLTSNPVRIKEISLDSPAVTYEVGAGGDNLSAIQKHIDSQLAKLGSGAKDKSSSPGRRFVIDHVYVRNAKVSYAGAVTLSMPDLHLRDVGKKSNGASAAEVTSEIWTAVTRSATRLAPQALKGVQEGAKGAVDKLRGLFK
jgi:hypothetical protein